MALNISTLTNPATSGDVLAEALTTADFLEGVPVLRNLARGSQKGGDAKQSVSLNQPRALPLIKNPSGNLGGYLYIPNVTGNYATGPSVTIGANQTWEAEVDMVVTQFGTSSPSKYVIPFGTQAGWNGGIGFWINHNANVVAWSKGRYTNTASGITLNTPFNIKYGFDGTNVFYKINDVAKGSVSGNDQSAVLTAVLQLNQQTVNRVGNYAIQKAKLTVNSAVVFDCDFNGSTSIRHGDTKFQAAVGGPVSLTRAGQDPVTVVKKDILRFDGADDNLKGLLGTTVTEGYAFLAFSVLGGGGEQFATCFGLNSTGGATISTDGYGITHRNSERLQSFNSNVALDHQGLFDDANGDILHEVKFTSGSQISKINNADQLSSSTTTTISSEEFSIAERVTNGLNTAFDLEYLALFPATITDAQADSVRNYINNRNNLFSLIDSQGYYFFDPQKATFTGNFTNFGGGNRLDGYITGSDNGDTDVRSNLTLIQETGNDQPSTDGYTITFHDNAEHLGFKNGVSQNLSGWQVVGTSLGTFAYRVQGAVSELNLLGNAGGAGYRQSGQSYGMILLPETATGADIEEARKLLIDRGASDGVSGTSLNQFWRGRTDILEFNSVNTAGVTDMSRAWQDAGLTKFALLDTSSVTNLSSAFANCNLASFPLIDCSSITQMGYAFYSNNFSDFPAIQAPLCSNFSGVWNQCSALTSFPAGAQLGTAVSNVNFTEAWRSSGLLSFNTNLPTGQNFTSCWRQSALTSFGAIDLSAGTTFTLAWQQAVDLVSFGAIDARNGTTFQEAWKSCTNLTSFPAGAKLGTSASNVNFSSAWQSSGLTSFPALDTSRVTNMNLAWYDSNLATFSLIDTSNVTQMNYAWGDTNLTSFPQIDPSSATSMFGAWVNNNLLTDFPAIFSNWNPSTITTGVFGRAWEGCSALSAISVENILTSIDASGKYATSTGASGGSALADAGIDIDYNTATGSLSAATNAAVTSLKAKGWSIIVNNVTL